ncbi:MAG: metal-dependent transcriptional regulator [Candidatus Bipolaricaulota bacterium]
MLHEKSIEDYLETVYNLSKKHQHVRTKQVAQALGVKPPSVTEMFQKLEEEDFVNYKPYGGVTLTSRGKAVAKTVRDAHVAIRKLFRLFNVSREQADTDACKVEHNLSRETVVQLKKFVAFIEGCPRGQPDWIKHFETFSETGKFPDLCRDDDENQGGNDNHITSSA